MRLPGFRIRTLMIAVAATAVFFESYIGLAEVSRWYFFYHRAQKWAQNLKQVESWTDARMMSCWRNRPPSMCKENEECCMGSAQRDRLRPHPRSWALSHTTC